jgi:hypothetical protein
VGPAQHGVGHVELPRGQGGPDGGGRHPVVGVGGRLAVDADQLDPAHIEAEVGAHRPQQLDVALASVAEVEVVADDHGPGAEATDEHLGDELLGRLERAGLVEVHDERVVDPGGLEQLELLVEVGEQQRGRLGPNHAGRVAIEGDHRGLQVTLGRELPHLADDLAMAAVHPVVRADGGDGARQRVGTLVVVVEHLHGDGGYSAAGLAPSAGGRPAPSVEGRPVAGATTTDGFTVVPLWAS